MGICRFHINVPGWCLDEKIHNPGYFRPVFFLFEDLEEFVKVVGMDTLKAMIALEFSHVTG